MYEIVEAIEGGTSRGERMVGGILQSLDLSDPSFVIRCGGEIVVIVVAGEWSRAGDQSSLAFVEENVKTLSFFVYFFLTWKSIVIPSLHHTASLLSSRSLS